MVLGLKSDLTVVLQLNTIVKVTLQSFGNFP